MSDKSESSPSEEHSDALKQADTFAAGDAVLDRVKSVAQRIAEQVRRLTEEAPQGGSNDAATDATPRSD